MWRKALAPILGATASVLLGIDQTGAAENFNVKTLVPTFGGATSVGANVSTILALRLWTTLRPRPNPNPNNLFFGVGQIEWSERVIEDSPDAALQVANETRSHLALWGSVEEYGRGVVVTASLAVPTGQAVLRARQTWTVTVQDIRLELGVPNSSYQFSPLVLTSDVVAKYSRPNQVRICQNKDPNCNGPALRAPFRAIKLEGDFILVRQPNGSIGWAPLPNLSEAQGEVVDFTAALISYLRGDFEQAESYFSKVRDSNAESLVRNDASLLGGISRFRRGQGIDALRTAQRQNRYSRYGVQALVMADIAAAAAVDSSESRAPHLKEAGELIASYRHLFDPGDRWLADVDRSLRILN